MIWFIIWFNYLCISPCTHAHNTKQPDWICNASDLQPWVASFRSCLEHWLVWL